jgi:excisionase family DNA binding protein
MSAARDELQPEPSGRRDPLLTADEVAELLRVTRAWVYTETRARRIPHVRLGRYVRYRRSAVETWVAELEAASTGRYAPRTPRRVRSDY